MSDKADIRPQTRLLPCISGRGLSVHECRQNRFHCIRCRQAFGAVEYPIPGNTRRKPHVPEYVSSCVRHIPDILIHRKTFEKDRRLFLRKTSKPAISYPFPFSRQKIDANPYGYPKYREPSFARTPSSRSSRMMGIRDRQFSIPSDSAICIIFIPSL